MRTRMNPIRLPNLGPSLNTTRLIRVLHKRNELASRLSYLRTRMNLVELPKLGRSLKNYSIVVLDHLRR